MSETNDNLFGETSEETISNNEQAVGEESNKAASTETTATESAEEMKAELERLRKQVANQQKLIGRKTIDKDVLRQLGIGGDEEPPVTKTQTQEIQRQAAQVTPSEIDAWLAEVEAKHGRAVALDAFVTWKMDQTLGQKLAPLNEQLNTARERVNRAAITTAVHRLNEEFGDVDEHTDAIKAYFKANPKKKEQLESPSLDEDEKYDLLEGAYLRVSRQKQKNSTAASKAAGAVESKQREQAKASSVTSGSGARSSKADTEKSVADKWFEDMTEHDKGRKLF